MSRMSPMVPKLIVDLPPLAGVRLASGRAGIRYKDRDDLMLMEFAPDTTVAGMFTRSTTAGPPVEWCRAALRGGRIRAVVANSGNANAFTGDEGRAVVRATADAAAGLLGCPATEVFVASTGVIGEPPPAHLITSALSGLADRLESEGWLAAASAIQTTDTYAKVATRTCKVDGRAVRLNGLCKGAAMLAPNMATMLVYLATDAALAPAVLQACLKQAVDASFNSITIDSDTSTSDTVILGATGRAGHTPIALRDDPRLAPFQSALDDLCLDLALQIVRDGEGATKAVQITITGAKDDASARRIADGIANSPLVKTAVAGGDANWGRIVMAVGKTLEPVDQSAMRIVLGEIEVAAGGRRLPDLDEAATTAYFEGDWLEVEVDVGVGRGRARVWTCDLTEEYVNENARYRT